MLAEKIKEISKELGWIFKQGNFYWQNLADFPDDSNLEFKSRQVYILLHWVDKKISFNEYSTPVGNIYTGEFVIAVRSRIDDVDYEYKYEKNIKPIKELTELLFPFFGICHDLYLKELTEVEVVNILDTNLDGVKYTFTISQEL